jgi:hypothetical protein
MKEAVSKAFLKTFSRNDAKTQRLDISALHFAP